MATPLNALVGHSALNSVIVDYNSRILWKNYITVHCILGTAVVIA